MAVFLFLKIKTAKVSVSCLKKELIKLVFLVKKKN